jgi:ribose transport system permease protein
MSVVAPKVSVKLRREQGAALRWIVRNGLAVWVIVIGIVVWLLVSQPTSFLASSNISDLLSDTVVLGLVGVGETFVIISGGIDLSVGSLATLTAVLCAGMIDGHASLVVPVVLLMMAIGVVLGTAQGLLVAKARIEPFIVTLTSYFILAGVAYAYTPIPIGSVPIWLSNAFFASIGPIPWFTLITLVIGVVLSGLLSRTPVGRHIYAIGGSSAMARVAGVKVARVTVLCYVISGVLAALAGCVLTFRSGVGVPNAGSGLELLAITTVVVGGASLAGGRGRLIGTAGGVLLLALIQNAFLLLSISSYYQSIVTGIVIVAAVALFVRHD